MASTQKQKWERQEAKRKRQSKVIYEQPKKKTVRGAFGSKKQGWFEYRGEAEKKVAKAKYEKSQERAKPQISMTLDKKEWEAQQARQKGAPAQPAPQKEPTKQEARGVTHPADPRPVANLRDFTPDELRAGIASGEIVPARLPPTDFDLVMTAIGATGLSSVAGKGIGMSKKLWQKAWDARHLGKAGKGVAAGAGKLPLGKGAITVIKEQRRARAINKLAMRTGKSPRALKKLVDKAEVTKGVNKIVENQSPAKLAKLLGKAAAGFWGTETIIAWYALDNVITGQRFYAKNILSGVEGGYITPEQAAEAMEESTRVRDIAINVVEKATQHNPLLWAFRNLLLTGMEADQMAIELTTDRISAMGREAEEVEEAPEGKGEGYSHSYKGVDYYTR